MKKFRLRILIYIAILAGLISMLSFSCFKTWQMIAQNIKIKNELEQKYEELLDKEDTLEGEVIKLQDPEYVAKYAREKYLYTKEGEIVIDMTK